MRYHSGTANIFHTEEQQQAANSCEPGGKLQRQLQPKAATAEPGGQLRRQLQPKAATAEPGGQLSIKQVMASQTSALSSGSHSVSCYSVQHFV